MEVDQIYSERTAENVLRDLRKEGRLKWAELERGVDYRIYPARCPDPIGAERVKIEGKEYVPDTEMAEPDEETEQEVISDGGTKTDAKQDLERIREARDGDEASTETVETFTCPIEGCNRTIVGSPGHLRNHVSQSGDTAHRFRTLNEALELEFDEEVYHAMWGPGVQPSEPAERDSIYDPGDPWGPGVPG